MHIQNNDITPATSQIYIYNILSLTKSTLFTTDTYLWLSNILLRFDDFILFSIEKIKSAALTVPPLSHLPSYVPNKSNLYLINSLVTVVIDPDL